MLSYFAYASVVDANLNKVADLGLYTMIFQGYTGGTYNTRDINLYISYLQSHLENFSFFGGSVIVANGFSQKYDSFLPICPALVPIYLGNITDGTYKLMLTFPDNGDYLLGDCPLINTSAGFTFLVFDVDGNQLYSSVDIPGAINRLNDPSSQTNSPMFRMVPSNKITDTGFDVSTVFADYYISPSINNNWYYIYSKSNINLYRFLNRHTPNNPPVRPDPYASGGSTTTGGGEGTGPSGIINDDIDFPSPLRVAASNANFISIWTPTLDQVQNLAAWMWTTDPLKWEFWQKLLQNPLDLIFSLTIMPVPIYHPSDGGTPAEDELVANTDSLSLGWQDTGILMDWVTEQYVTIDMGTIDLEEVWGAFLDYEPYTKIDIFLPYIGTKQLDTNDCMPRSISLRYIIDLATGTCVALIKCDNSVYYHFSGNCASQIPITVNQCQEIVRGLMTMAVGAATFAIGGPMGAGAHASKGVIAKGAAMQAGGAAMVGSGADTAAKGVNVSRSGVIGAAAGLMDVQTPYLIISRPRQAVPEDQNKYTGYPSFITEQIGDLSGYTEVQMIHLHNMSCTDEEYKEIDSLLTQGVII